MDTKLDAAPDAPSDSSPTPAPQPAGATASIVDAAVAAVAVAGGVAAAFADVAPTGNRGIDWVLVATAVATVAWFGSRRDGMALAAAVAGGVISWTWAGATVGVGAASIASMAAVARPWNRVVNAALVALALNLAARSQIEGVLGLSTLLSVGLATIILVAGFGLAPRAQRRALVGVMLAVAAIAIVAVAALVVGGLSATDDLREASDRTDAALDALQEGDFDTARDELEQAAEAFDAADGQLDTPLTAPVAIIPVLAQHHDVATTLTAEGAAASRDLAEQLERVDLDALTVTDGKIDLDEVRALEDPLEQIDARVAELDATIRSFDSPWLLAPVTEELDELADRTTEQLERSERAITVVGAAPALLGGDEPRTYFIGFTTPSEARGLGGFMGNWAEVSVDDGSIEMTAFGRGQDLIEGGDPSTRRFPDEPDFETWLARYGPYVVNEAAGGITREAAWKNLNMSPDMSMTGRAVASLYPQSGGGELDGVFVLDVYTLARLLEFTGPVPLPDELDVDGLAEVDASTATRFFLNQQYDLTEIDERIDVLEVLSGDVIARLLSGSLPATDEWIDRLGPMIEQGRLSAWMERADEQELLADLGWTGTLPAPGDDDGLAITLNNVAGNKIDYYLTGEAQYDVSADARTGSATATLGLGLTNEAPPSGEPGYVIKNLVGLPVGANRTWVSIYSRLPVEQARLDGAPISFTPGLEAGLFVASTIVVLESGETAQLEFDMAGPLDVADGYRLEVRSPPVVDSLPIEIGAQWTDTDGSSDRTDASVEQPGLHVVTVPDVPR